MIYKVLLDGVSIFDPERPEMVLLSPVLQMEVNTAGSFEFTMPPGHVFYDSPGLLTSDVEVYEGDSLFWYGRPVEVKVDYFRQKKVYCEGALTFFNDSVQEPAEYEEVSIREYFRSLIECHNSQVPERRRFTAGTVTVPDRKVYRKRGYSQTLDVMKKQCIGENGGYFFTRREDGINYIDWLADMPYTCSQPIEFGLNLLDLSGSSGGGEAVTCILPLGENDAATGKPVTVESVNSRSKVVESEAAKIYGRITKAVSFSGVSDPATLMRDAQEYLSDRQFGKLAFECDASELHFINPCYDAFRVGQVIHCISKPHLLSCDLPLTKISLRLDEATKKITLGSGTEKSLTEAASDGFYTGQDGDEPGLAGDTEDWKHWIGTQAEYDALKERDFKTVYFIEAEKTS